MRCTVLFALRKTMSLETKGQVINRYYTTEKLLNSKKSALPAHILSINLIQEIDGYIRRSKVLLENLVFL